MKLSISAMILILVVFGILALSCEKPKEPEVLGGVVWNKSNASVYVPNYRNSGIYNPAPLSRPYKPIPLN